MIPDLTKNRDRMPLGRRFGASWTAGFALLALAPAACATALPAAAAHSEQPSRIVHACAQTMGLSPGTLDYSDCVASLSKSAADAQSAQNVQNGRSACSTQGLKEGTPDFALCVLDHEHSLH
jgi:hypothetical protein